MWLRAGGTSARMAHVLNAGPMPNRRVALRTAENTHLQGRFSRYCFVSSTDSAHRHVTFDSGFGAMSNRAAHRVGENRLAKRHTSCVLGGCPSELWVAQPSACPRSGDYAHLTQAVKFRSVHSRRADSVPTTIGGSIGGPTMTRLLTALFCLLGAVSIVPAAPVPVHLMPRDPPLTFPTTVGTKWSLRTPQRSRADHRHKRGQAGQGRVQVSNDRVHRRRKADPAPTQAAFDRGRLCPGRW